MSIPFVGQDSFEEFPLGSESSMDDDTFEELMGVHDCLADDCEVFVSNPNDPTTFDTIPYESPALSMETSPEPSSPAVPKTVEDIDARIASLQCFDKVKDFLG